MLEEMAQLKSMMHGGQQQDKFKTPPPRKSPPSPAAQKEEIKPRKLDKEADAAAGSKKDKVMPSAQPTEEPSEEASLQRLRRLCEVKPSGPMQCAARDPSKMEGRHQV